MKRIVSLIIAAAMVFGTMTTLMLQTVLASDNVTVVHLDPSDASPFNNGEFQGWGTSMGWWGNRIGYSDKMAKQAAEIFYGEDGLGLDIVRYNIGGGDRPEHIEAPHITRSDSKMPCFAVPTLDSGNNPTKDSDGKYVYIYNWNADYNQVNVLKEIKKQNNDVHIEGYTNSPPWFMTESLCSGGGVNGAENLAVENYDDFAEFIGDVAEHFEEEGLKFDSYSPMNEPKPETKYWAALNDKQEGNLVAQGEHQSGLILAVSNEFKKRGIDTIVAGMDETDINYSISAYQSLSNDAKKALGRLDTHTYGHKNGGFNRAGLKQTAIDADKNLWMSEVDGGWNGFGLAQRIIEDMNGMMPSAWVMWDIIDSHKDSTFTYPEKTSDSGKDESSNTLNAAGSMWGVGMADHDKENIELANKYYFYGQFTRYINPGDTIIASSSNTLAAYNKTTGDIKIVALNSGNTDKPYTFDLGSFTNVGTTVKEYRTNNATGESAEHWADIAGEATLNAKKLDTTLKAGTLTTYVIEGAGATDYMTISGASTMVVGVGYNYTVSRGSSAEAPEVTWTVSDLEAATVTETGVVTAKKGGSFTLTATDKSDGAYTTLDIQALSTDQTIRIVNKKSGLGLETKNKAINSGTQLMQWADRGIDTAAWKLSATSDGHFNIANANNDMLLANSNGTLVISDSITDDNAKWDLINHGGYYEVKNIGAGKSLNVSGQSTANGGSVILYTFAGADNELWSFAATEGTLTHVTVEPVDYSAKYTGTDFTYVSNIAAATNDFNEGDLKGFETTGTGGATSDGAGEAVLGVQSEYSNKDGVAVSGSATLTLDPAITCEDNQIINMAFDVYCSNSGGTADFGIYGTDNEQLMKLVVSGWDNYTINTGNVETVETGNAKPYLRNNVNDKMQNQLIANGGHMEIYYKPSTGIIKVTLKNNTNSSALKSYEGRVKPGTPISKLVFNANYTTWSKPMYVDNLVTNIVTYNNDDFDNISAPELSDEPEQTPQPTEKPTATDAPVLPSNGELINLNFNGSLDSTSTYGKATALDTAKFAEVDGRQAIQFDGTGATAIKLTDANGNPLLTGQESLTISFKIKPMESGSTASWWFFAAPNDSKQVYKSEHYIGALTKSGTIEAERYNSSNINRPVQASGAVTANEWNDVEIHINQGNTSIFVNGVKQGSADTSVNIKDMLGSESVAYIGLANWKDNNPDGEFATGYMDDFVIKNYSLPTVQAYRSGTALGYTSDYSPSDGYDMFIAVRDRGNNLIGASKSAKDSFELPDENGTYTVTEYLWKNMEPMTDPITVTPKTINDGYLFAHFKGEGLSNGEQIYFSLSTTAEDWHVLNGGAPVLTSTLGEKGVRDPYIMRTEDNKFVIIATDLKINGNNDWSKAQREGSKSLVVWQSDDLINWGNANLREVAVSNAGCTWAPEAIYDSEKGKYMVFWASMIDGKHSIYRAYTSDFESFDSTELYITKDFSVIDTTIIKNGDTYYRFNKNEATGQKYIFMEKSNSLSGEWTSVDTFDKNQTGFEGPTIFKVNGEDKWCLMLDAYNNGGYKPFFTENLATGKFTDGNAVKYDGTYRHGTVMPITGEEYVRLVTAY